MIFTKTNLQGVWVVEIEMKQDDRGFFARSWCQKEFEDRQITAHIVQVNLTFNKRAGTIRGMHYQDIPFQESKLMRCTKGAIYDVALDLRKYSSTYKQWIGVELTSDNYKMLYIPEGCAHGYQTLEDNVEVAYQVSQFYSPQSERGARYDDPAFAISWPLAVSMISAKDQSWPDYGTGEPAGAWLDIAHLARNGRRG